MSSTPLEAEPDQYGGNVCGPRPRAHVPNRRDDPDANEPAPRRAPGTVRRAPSRAVVWSDPDTGVESASIADITRMSSILGLRSETVETGAVLHLSGSLEMADLLRLRDAAFTLIGTRPATLCLDVRLVSRIEFAGINTLLTIGRVARLSHIHFTVRASSVLAQHLKETGLARTLTLDETGADSENTRRHE